MSVSFRWFCKQYFFQWELERTNPLSATPSDLCFHTPNPFTTNRDYSVFNVFTLQTYIAIGLWFTQVALAFALVCGRSRAFRVRLTVQIVPSILYLNFISIKV